MANFKMGDWVVETPEIPGTVVPGTMGTATILGTEYPTVVMPDGKEWMSTNLRTTQAPNKAPNGNEANVAIYGRLYQYDIATALTYPDGWHVPLQAEWDAMIAACGGAATAGGKLKSQGTTNWQAPNTGATDAFGFSALPAGSGYGSSFFEFGQYANFWTAWAFSIGSEVRYVGYNTTSVVSYDIPLNPPSDYWFSVRLVRDYTPPPIPATRISGTHDILIGGDGTAETTESLAQRIDIRLRTFAGEHWLNPELGIPWFRDFLIKAPDLAVCRQVLWDTILGVRGVQTINRLDLAISKATRVLTITFAVNGADSFTSTITV